MSSDTPSDVSAKIVKDLLGVEPSASNESTESKYPRLPSGVMAFHDLTNNKLIVDIEAGGFMVDVKGDGLPWVNVTMVDGEIVSAKNEDGTDSDIFKP